MKTSTYRFIDTVASDSFRNLASLLEAGIRDNVLTLPPHRGKGNIQELEICKGLKVAAWNVYLRDELEVIKIPPFVGTSRVFTLIYIFTPGHLLLQDASFKDEIRMSRTAHFLFDPGAKDLRFNILPGVETKALVINIDAKWVKDEFSVDVAVPAEYIYSLMERSDPLLYYYSVLPDDYKSAAELFQHFTGGPRDMLYIKGNIFLLLSRFFKTIITAKPGDMDVQGVLHYKKMMEVEKILTDHIDCELPSISEIAKEVALSESSLKRYFRMVFQTSLYDYYLQKKMAYAKIQLTEKMMPVKEVAYMLGYENCGSFIRIFKKYHNLPPGLLQRNGKKQNIENGQA